MNGRWALIFAFGVSSVIGIGVLSLVPREVADSISKTSESENTQAPKVEQIKNIGNLDSNVESKSNERHGPSRKIASASFSPMDKELVRSRAIDAVFDMKSEILFDSAQINTGEYSAQVYFQQSANGLPVLPEAGVSVDLSMDGDVIRIHQNLIAAQSIGNSRTQNLHSSYLSAKSYLGASNPAGLTKSEDGREVMFVRNQVGYHAVEYHFDGIQIVVNAEDGSLLLKRDRRTN